MNEKDLAELNTLLNEIDLYERLRNHNVMNEVVGPLGVDRIALNTLLVEGKNKTTEAVAKLLAKNLPKPIEETVESTEVKEKKVSKKKAD